ncbi:MAG: Cell envelope-related transcriptional attenuator [Candidatus Woesebacteria bacterium GW2011_GWB1_41_10]|uniref:Cell envelope-related transcriptional attenuator n=1 Tax=Candidatus Woesebacteria bacterium GW2011_GWB1_41_10 TaxID=1618577 RepID=A0A0G0UA04_9BACT|nr:MAG: Cell envelope-related transcriptional attenuator [Candidatus Woesebacteria bacterium GW2011_GWB1_41_10]
MVYFNIMPDKDEKPRKKIVVEEVKNTPSIEVPPQTEPHIEPGIHEEIKEIKSGINPLFIIIPGIFLLGALLGGIVYYQKNISGIKITVTTPVPTISETASPIPTASSEVDTEKYDVKILNGSGIAGEAGKARGILEKAGFKVSSTGNATSYNYTKTVIQVKSSVEKEFVSALTEALSKTYEVDSKTKSLSASSPDDVVIIVGSSKSSL